MRVLLLSYRELKQIGVQRGCHAGVLVQMLCAEIRNNPDLLTPVGY